MRQRTFKILKAVIVLCLLAGSRAGSAGEALSIADLAVPESLGKVERRYQGTSSRWVIHIQDIHAHAGAQENIAAILDHLHTLYGIKTIALEGGWSETTFPKSWGLPSTTEKQLFARTLLERDHLTGPGYAALFSPKPLRLVGMEEEALYEANRQLFLEHLNQRQEILMKIRSWGDRLEAEKRALFRPELQEFDKALDQFRKGKQADQFIPKLLGWCRDSGIPLGDLDQIRLFQTLLEKQRLIDRPKLQAEANRLMSQFKGTRLTFEELLRSGKLPKEKLELYPSSRLYLELLQMQDELQYRPFFSQIEEAIGRLKDKIFTTAEERALEDKMERFRIAGNLLLLEATPDHLKTWRAEKAPFETEAGEAGLGDPLALAWRFYEKAEERDDIFFRRLLDDPRLEGDVAVVSGGFHTEGLTEKLEEAGISHVVITPDLGHEEPNRDLYFARMLEDFPSTQTVSPKLIIFAALFDEAFVAGVVVLAIPPRNIDAAFRTYLDKLGWQDAYRTPARPRPDQEYPGGIRATSDRAALGEDAFRQEFLRDVVALRDGTKPKLLIIAAADQEKLLEGRANSHLLKTLMDNKSVTIVFLGGVPEADFIGGKARVILVPEREYATIGDFVQSPLFDRLRQKAENRVAGFEGKELKVQTILIVPVEAEGRPLDGSLALVLSLLESDVDLRRLDLGQVRATLLRIQALLQSLANVFEFLESA